MNDAWGPIPESVSDPFFQGLVVRPPRILGRQLQPYSLGHDYLLRKIGNTVALRLGDVIPNDIVSFVWVCSIPFWDLTQKLFGDGDPVKFGWLLNLKMIFSGVNAVFEDCLTYMDNYTEFPDHEESGDPPDAYAAPAHYHTVRVLCSIYNFTHRQAWCTPCGYARSLVDTYGESQGSETLLSQHDRIKCTFAVAIGDAHKAGDTELQEKLQSQLNAYMKVVNDGRS